VELLTVMAIIAVLATLFLTAVVSVKKKSRAAVCTSNLRQISLALNMYLDDFSKRPGDIDEVVAGKYLAEPRALRCPEDKTGNWGRLTSLQLPFVPRSGAPASPLPQIPYSYLLHPLSWTDPAWENLMRQGSSAGLAACQLHGLGKQNLSFPSVFDFEGLLLRGQRDGAVVRRRLFWDQSMMLSGADFSLSPGGTAPSGGDAMSEAFLWQIYVDAK
jgi:type II secretory pathway pseudopilin PulG